LFTAESAYVISATLGTDNTLDSPILPGFSCPTADLFVDLPADNAS
jgi:hypothetical protein